ncbi:threonine synthase [Geosporobacter ferrireducens]|uniref:threonine synthase n=1 Tax=Geosporobacter ferrireducens TaxID=1424294 RepID=UPI00139EAB89|nr:threonine synthase [Geosporobacter ferrireducens]MTI57548.1 threonine synthase [Geosporobacter ferrireducens]
MGRDIKFYCTGCGKSYRIDLLRHRCGACNEPLEVEEIKQGKIREGSAINQSMLERYADFFPFLDIEQNNSLGEGFTPIVESKKLAKDLCIQKLYFKNESQNPTWSFKDRGTAAGVAHALQLGYKRIGTASTGNMATSVAAYGAKANLETFIFVSKGIAVEKLKPIAIYHPHLIKVEGDYGNLYFESLRIGEENEIYFINSDVPLRVEGSKTVAFEICEQLNFRMPDYVIVPTSAGGNIRGIEKGFREFFTCGLIDEIPKILCAQASGCSPIFNAYHKRTEKISRVENPNTIAHAIENPYPPSGNRVLKMIRENKGTAVAVSDEEIIKAQAMLAEEGIFGQPASAVPLAAAKKLREENYIKADETVVCVVTGSGLKYTAALERHQLDVKECNLEELSSFIKDRF